MNTRTALPTFTAAPASGLGIALALAGAIGFSGKAILAKLMYQHGVDAVTVVAWRMLIALPMFLAMALWAGRGKPSLSRRDGLAVLGLGFTGYYASSMLDFYGLMFVSAGLERLILYLGPTIVMALSVLWVKKPVTRRQWVAAAVSYAGTALVFGREWRAEGEHIALGAALVFASAVCYSIYLIASGELVPRVGALRLTGLASSAACVFCLLHFVAVRPLGALVVPEPVLWWSVLNALACTVAPILMVMMAIERIGSALAAQVGMVGPVSTIAMGVWVLDEPFTLTLLVGTVLVMAGVTLASSKRA